MIASIHHPLVKHLAKLRLDRDYREKKGTVLISGFKLIKEIAALVCPQKVLIENLVDASLVPACPEIYRVNSTVLKKITGLPSPEPIAAEFLLPSPSNLKNKTPLLVLDAIQDPGNIGTLIRSASAFGWAGIFFLPGCVDPFSDKVIRSSRAALFHFPWQAGDWEVVKEMKEKQNYTAYIADTEGKLLSSVQPEKKIFLLLSNEAQGVQKQAMNFGKKITIPMQGKMESLNVAIAGAILMYFLKH